MNNSASNGGQMPQQAVVTKVCAIAGEIPRTSFGADDPMQIKIANMIFIKGEPLSDNNGDKFFSENEEMYLQKQ
eukprot:scaffold25742_cov108-Cylindrotheca_fusiformis.AAC.2